jgi:hypothetical protein
VGQGILPYRALNRQVFFFFPSRRFGSIPIIDTGFPRIGIVLRGEGTVYFDNGELPVKQGDELFFPFHIPGRGVIGQYFNDLLLSEGSPKLI